MNRPNQSTNKNGKMYSVASNFSPYPNNLGYQYNNFNAQPTMNPFASIRPPVNQYYPSTQVDQWSHNIPNVMPWTNHQPSIVDSNQFSFSSPSLAVGGLATYPATSFVPQCPPSSPASLNRYATSGPSSPPSNESMQCDLNVNNKRSIETVSDPDTVVEFDFDSRRPIKKYICEEKVLEIFDRLHIREGDHYIVEDVSDEDGQAHGMNSFKHNYAIEEVSDPECMIEFSPQLKSALNASNSSDITSKLLKYEQEKLSKALVIYRPNTILESIKQEDESDEDSSKEKEVKIEEVFSDDEDEEMMEDLSTDNNLRIEQISTDEESLDTYEQMME